MKNYYEILGVSPFATQDEIKTAYREKMKKYHPDKHQEDESGYYEKKAKLLNEAYETLSNKEKRNAYDVEYASKIAEEAMKQHRRKQEAAKREERKYNDFYDFDDFEDNREYRTNRRKSREKSKHKVKDNSFFGSIRKSYREVKEDESKQPFKERHKNLNDRFYNNYAEKVDSNADLIAFRVGQGIVHVSAELLYQLSKLSYINKDNLMKYLLRNRRLVAAILAGVMISSIIPGPSEKTVEPAPNEVAGVVVEEPTEVYDENITLMRNYTVKMGDSFSSLSDMTLTKISDIKRVNGFTTDMLYIGDVIKLPYIVNKEDLQYYTETVDTNGMSLYDLANFYETDEDTLYRLNQEAVSEVDGAHIITTSKVLVPKFISSNELQERKEGKVKTY